MQEILSKKNLGSRLKRLRLKYQLSQEEIAAILNLSRSNYSQIELGNQYPTYEVLTKLSKYYNKSYEWLLHGKEAIVQEFKKVQENPLTSFQAGTIQLSNTDNLPSLNPTIWYDDQRIEKVALVNNVAKADYIDQFSSLRFIKSLPVLSIPIPLLKDGGCRAFEVEGSSMKSTLNDQDIIVGKFVYDFRNITFSNIYVIVTEKEILIKRIINYLPDTNHLIYTSDNESFNPCSIHISKVLEVWEVIGKFSTEICRIIDDIGFHVSRFDNILYELKLAIEKLKNPEEKPNN